MIGGLLAMPLAVVVMLLAAEHLRFDRRRKHTMTIRRTAETSLASKPIDPVWLLDGERPSGEAPLTEAATLAANDDATVAVYLWQTTRARYRWEHASDEVVTVVDGEAFLSDHDVGSGGIERRLGPGDVAFFPAGSRSTWRVPVRLRKVSTLIRPLPRAAASLFRWMRGVKRAAIFLAKRGSTASRNRAGH